MLTPQEVSEHAFAKASFGGYNMAMVDEFLDALTVDYTALYKENAVLKSKMKVLVDKVEEYRSTEDAMRKALLTAQKMADEMVQDAEQKKTQMLAQAETEARMKIAGLQQELENEEARLASAQSATAVYAAKVKEICAQEVAYLDRLDQLVPAPKVHDHVGTAAQDIASSMHRMAEEAEAEYVPVSAVEDAASFDTKPIHAPTPEREAPEETLPPAPAEEEQAGGLYDDLAAAGARRTPSGMEEVHFDVTLGQPRAPHDEPAAEEHPPVAQDTQPTRRIDFDHLQFGKDYEIK